LLAVGRLLLLRLKDMLSVVHELTHRRVCLRRDHDEVQLGLRGNLSRLLQGNDTLLGTVLEDETHLFGVDLVVDEFALGLAALLLNSQFSITVETSRRPSRAASRCRRIRKPSTDITPRSFPARSRTATLPASTSLSPHTSI